MIVLIFIIIAFLVGYFFFGNQFKPKKQEPEISVDIFTDDSVETVKTKVAMMLFDKEFRYVNPEIYNNDEPNRTVRFYNNGDRYLLLEISEQGKRLYVGYSSGGSGDGVRHVLTGEEEYISFIRDLL